MISNENTLGSPNFQESFPLFVDTEAHFFRIHFTSKNFRKIKSSLDTLAFFYYWNHKKHTKILLTKAFMFNVRRNGRLCVSAAPLLKFIYGLEAYFLYPALAYHPAVFHFTSISSSYAISNIHCNTRNVMDDETDFSRSRTAIIRFFFK